MPPARIAIDPKPKNLVLYLSAHGGADADGAYLWLAPPKAESATEAHKVRVRDIIERVRRLAAARLRCSSSMPPA